MSSSGYYDNPADDDYDFGGLPFTQDEIEMLLVQQASLEDWQVPPMQSAWEDYGSEITWKINNAVMGTFIGDIHLTAPYFDPYEQQKLNIFMDAFAENKHVFEEFLEEKSIEEEIKRQQEEEGGDDGPDDETASGGIGFLFGLVMMVFGDDFFVEDTRNSESGTWDGGWGDGGWS